MPHRPGLIGTERAAPLEDEGDILEQRTRGIVAEVISPGVAEGRRGGATAALARPRSYGGTFSTAGASGER